MIAYREFDESLLEDVKEIYRRNHWTAYLQDDEKLLRAFRQSLYLLGAFDGDRLVGFARCVGDGEHVLLVQDLILLPEYQRQRIGTGLLDMAKERYRDVREFFVLTDLQDEGNNTFYRKSGLTRLEENSVVGYMR